MIREAQEKTGKYVHAILKQLEQQLGVHAVILVAYKDTQEQVKVSEWVPFRMIKLYLIFSKL